MLEIERNISALTEASARLRDKANKLNSSVLYTEDNAILNLQKKLLLAADNLDKTITELNTLANKANQRSIFWEGR